MARSAATLLVPGQVVILDGGSTAPALAETIPAGHTGTFVTHSPPVAEALGRHDGLEVVVVGGTLDRRAMVATGTQTVDAYRRISADACFLGIWSVNAEHGLSEGYPEEAEVGVCCSRPPIGSSGSHRATRSARWHRSRLARDRAHAPGHRAIDPGRAACAARRVGRPIVR